MMIEMVPSLSIVVPNMDQIYRTIKEGCTVLQFRTVGIYNSVKSQYFVHWEYIMGVQVSKKE